MPGAVVFGVSRTPSASTRSPPADNSACRILDYDPETGTGRAARSHGEAGVVDDLVDLTRERAGVHEHGQLDQPIPVGERRLGALVHRRIPPPIGALSPSGSTISHIRKATARIVGTVRPSEQSTPRRQPAAPQPSEPRQAKNPTRRLTDLHRDVRDRAGTRSRCRFGPGQQRQGRWSATGSGPGCTDAARTGSPGVARRVPGFVAA